jgi:FAD/FMN-containing dehydrogenase/Fe-S oxidoreductase
VAPGHTPGVPDAARHDLADAVRGQVRFGEHDRLLYATDASLYQVEPLGVVVPADIDDLERAVQVCARHGLAILPRGGGTSLAGQCTNRAVVIDASSWCRAIGEIERVGDTATVWVEPGVTVDELNRELAVRRSGLFFAPDPATSAQAAIGGCIGNNSAGARSIRYGRTSENLAAIDVLLTTGERVRLQPGAGAADATARRLGAGVIDIVSRHARLIRERFPRTIRRNAGYGLDLVLNQIEAPGGTTPERVDLSGLMCGSEGTLGVTTGAKLRLMPAPRARGLAVLTFFTLEDAIASVTPILDMGLPMGLTAIELLDDVVLDAAMGNIEYRRYVEMLPGGEGAAEGKLKAVLYVEFSAFSDGHGQELASAFAALQALARHLPGWRAMESSTDAGAMLKAWKLRKAGEPLLHGLPGNRKPVTFVEDNAVPVERLGEFVRGFKEIVGRHGTRAAYWAHASVGVLHVRPMIDLHDADDRRRLREIAVEVADLARSCGGIMSGEHGDGRVRGPLLERFFGPELMGAFAEVKELFDPQRLLNPGNIVGAGPVASITENLRVDAGAARDESKVTTFFDFSDQHGLFGAAEMCNGAGLCRKRAGGTMCPSYMATMDERHATRGRANALRLAMTGQVAKDDRGGPVWDDPETMKTLDWCLSCKACKSECPSNVDVARLKSEYTAQRHRERGRTPLGALLTGRVRFLNRLGSMTPGLANWFNSTRPARLFFSRVMKMSQRRRPPRFERSLYAWLRSRGESARPANARRVVIFADCFTAYNEPSIGIAAVLTLESLGYAVDVLPREGAGGFDAGCCGRSMISVGMLGEAIETADATLASLRPAIDDPGVEAVLVCEPSCLSAFKDDWLQLKLRSPMELRRRLAGKAMLVEEFVGRVLARAGQTPHPGGPVLVHAHCHQKALWGAETSAAPLRTLFGDRVKVLDTGCCGMAGSFGYAEKNYELSMKIAELALAPAVRAAGEDAVVVATGTSCRHQVHDATGRRALHPIELIARALRVI